MSTLGNIVDRAFTIVSVVVGVLGTVGGLLLLGGIWLRVLTGLLPGAYTEDWKWGWVTPRTWWQWLEVHAAQVVIAFLVLSLAALLVSALVEAARAARRREVRQ